MMQSLPSSYITETETKTKTKLQLYEASICKLILYKQDN